MASLARVAAISSIVGLLQVISVTPAQAAYSQCPADRFCVWTASGGTGSFAYFQSGSADLRNPIGGVVFDNKITSVRNRTGQHWCLYKGYGYTGDSIDVIPTGVWQSGSDLPGIFDNQVSSLRPSPC